MPERIERFSQKVVERLPRYVEERQGNLIYFRQPLMYSRSIQMHLSAEMITSP